VCGRGLPSGSGCLDGRALFVHMCKLSVPLSLLRLVAGDLAGAPIRTHQLCSRPTPACVSLGCYQTVKPQLEAYSWSGQPGRVV
jgi:hypothetical protein